MPNVSAKSVVGRQSQLPFRRALQISMKSLKIRFWRSIITAGGIFLGIAFLTTILTQQLMQWPIPEKVDPGFVRISGEVEGPGDYEVWKRIPVSEGLRAGLPQDVIDKVANEDGTFSLAAVLQGKLDALRADKNLARVQNEWKGLKPLAEPVQFWVDVKDDKDITVQAAIDHGVPAKIAKELAGEEKTFKGSWLVDVIREQPKWISPFHMAIALDQDITLDDAVKNGVPEAIARHLIGEGKSFKGGGLNDAIKAHPNWLKIWSSRQNRYEVFKKADDAVIEKLGAANAYTLGEILDEAKGFLKDKANTKNVMIVNDGGRKQLANFKKDEAKAQAIALKNGDNIWVPDLNSYYRMIWLVVMSLLVCTVGITNSMLMSVTERFKEIGTMKCLGALDKFVVTLFMLESGMMGVVASVMGWVVGFVIMLVLAGFSKGWDIVANIGLGDVVAMFFFSILVGMVLTVIATIAPAQRAAKMPAAMALRSEI